MGQPPRYETSGLQVLQSGLRRLANKKRPAGWVGSQTQHHRDKEAAEDLCHTFASQSLGRAGTAPADARRQLDIIPPLLVRARSAVSCRCIA
eukprot:jgi/Tetstr1/459521/TSEL_004888.t1